MLCRLADTETLDLFDKAITQRETLSVGLFTNVNVVSKYVKYAQDKIMKMPLTGINQISLNVILN